ncbi:MAG: hypothetical protein AAF889_04110 [Cyanobacteria bacterium P01_D01_bin.73]
MKIPLLQSLPRINLTIRQRIVSGYLAMLGVIAAGSAIGWSVGTHYQEQARKVHLEATKERQFLEDLHVAILSVQPGKKLLPILEELRRFRQESQSLSARLLSVMARLERRNRQDNKGAVEPLENGDVERDNSVVNQFLNRYKKTVSEFEKLSYERLGKVKILLGTPNGTEESRNEVLELIKSQEFTNYINFSDRLFEWKLRVRKN